MLCGLVGGCIHVDVGVAGDDHRVPPTGLLAPGYICVSAQNTARPAQGEQQACGPWTLMRVRPPFFVRIFRAGTFLWTSSVKLSTSFSAMYLLLTAVRKPPLREVKCVFAKSLLKEGVYHLSLSAAATCISCVRVTIAVSWSKMAKPFYWGSMQVMKCPLSVPAAGPRRRRSVPRRDRSGETRPLRRFKESSQRGSSAPSSWSQLSLIAMVPRCLLGPQGPSRPARARGSGEPAHRGPTGGRRPALRGWNLCGPRRHPQGPHWPAVVPLLGKHQPQPLVPPRPLPCRAPGGRHWV